jgi:NADH-quinone oxidoreductase subunit G
MSEIEIEIDGKKLQAEPNAMVIQVADAAGIYIPRFCYHKHLSIAANCRMCLVEVEKSPKALPACATPVMPGMKVFTRSAKAIAAQKAVMEFLLINHPLDCPICDQGGECELQDLSMGYGSAESYYNDGKRVVKDQDIGPLVATDMTRCIQCTRCVRFGSEVAGFRELGVVNRGEQSEITTYIQHALESEVSGNIIDLCPVGALTSKPYRFTARPWELQQFPSVAAHDCVGSNVNVHTRRGKVMRVVPRENVAINQTWISDRDRYSYEGLYHVDRLEKPLIRVGEEWQQTDWRTALEFALEGLQRVLNTHGADQLGALASPNSTVEEHYLLQKLMRGVGSANVDHRLRQVDFTDQENMPIFPSLGMPLADLNQCDTIVIIGSNLQREQPLISLRVRQAALKGAKVIVVNMMDYKFHFKVSKKKIIAPHAFVSTLTDLQQNKDEGIASLLKDSKKACVLLGAEAFNHPDAASIRSLAYTLATQCNATLSFLTEGANAAGAWLAGAVPHRGALGTEQSKKGLDAEAMLRSPRKGYLLLNVEPDLDMANPVAAINALSQSQFVVALASFKNPILEQFADVILPIAPFTETSGTYVNTEGKWQSFTGVATPVGETRPAWKVLRVLANFLHCEGFDYQSSEEVKNELEAGCRAAGFGLSASGHPLATDASFDSYKNDAAPLAYQDDHSSKLSRIGTIPIYSGDSLVRRAKSLQATQTIMLGNLIAARMHPNTAKQFELLENEQITLTQASGGRVRLPLLLDEHVPENGVYIAGGVPFTSDLSQLFGPIEIHKA